MFTDKNNNKIPDCVEKATIVAAASTMLLTGCCTSTVESETIAESYAGTLE